MCDGLGWGVCKFQDEIDFCPSRGQDYLTNLSRVLEPVINSTTWDLFKSTLWIFQQYSAAAHASKVTQSWLLGEKIEFFSKEWSVMCSVNKSSVTPLPLLFPRSRYSVTVTFSPFPLLRYRYLFPRYCYSVTVIRYPVTLNSNDCYSVNRIGDW